MVIYLGAETILCVCGCLDGFSLLSELVTDPKLLQLSARVHDFSGNPIPSMVVL